MAVKKDTVQVTLLLDGKQSINQLGKLEMEYADVRRSLKGLKKDHKDYQNLKNREKGLQAAIRKTRQELGLQGMTLQQLMRHTRDLERTRSNSTTKGTAEYKRLTREIKKATRMVRQQKMEARGMTGIWNSLGKQVKQFGIIAIGYLGISAVTSQLNNLMRRTADFSDLVTSVRKTTGMTETEIAELNETLGQLNTRTARKELLGMAKVAGKLGITARKDVEGFVSAFDKINVALGEDLGAPEEVAKKLGKILESFNINETHDIETGLLKVGSAINHLGKSSTASEGFIVEFTRRMAGIAPLAKLSIQDVLGLGATLDALGQTSEVSSTSLNKLFLKMTKNKEEFAQYALSADGAKMSSKEFADLIETDFNEAFFSLLRGVKGNSEGMTALTSTLVDLGLDGGRIIGVLGSLSNNTDLLAKQQKISREEYEKGTSVLNEFNLMNDTLGAKLDKVRKRLFAAFVNSDVVAGLETFVGWLEKITRVNVVEKLQKEQRELNILTRALINANDNESVRNRLIKEIDAKYPNFLKNMNKEALNAETLTARLKEVNKQYLQKIILQQAEEEIAAIAKKQIDLADRRYEAELRIAKLRSEPDKLVSSGTRAPKKTQGQLADSQEEAGFLTGFDTAIANLDKELAEIEARKERLAAAFNLDFFSGGTGAKTGGSTDPTPEGGAAPSTSASESDENPQFTLMASQIDAWHAEKLLKIKEQRVEEDITTQEYDMLEMELYLTHLVGMKELKESFGMESVALDQQIADAEFAIMDARMKKEKILFDKRQSGKSKEKKQQKEELKMRARIIESYVQEGMAAVESADSAEEAIGNVLNAIRREIMGIIAKGIAEGIAKEIGSKGIVGLATGAILGAGAAALFASIPSFYNGGETGNNDIGFGDRYGGFTGFTHADEFVVPAYVREDPQVIDAEQVIKAKMGGYSLEGNTGGTSNTAAGGNLSLDAQEFTASVQEFKELVTVLTEKGIIAEFSPEAFKEAKDYEDDLDSFRGI